MVSPVSFRCRHHPDRMAVAMCVACRTFICAECSTKVQGINTCLACLGKRAKPRETRVRRPSALLVPAGLALSFVFFWLVFVHAGRWALD